MREIETYIAVIKINEDIEDAFTNRFIEPIGTQTSKNVSCEIIIRIRKNSLLVQQLMSHISILSYEQDSY